MNEFLLVAGMTVVTFGVRYPVLAWWGKLPVPAIVLKSLKYVPSAVLTALIVPAILSPGGGPANLSLQNPYLVAAIVAIGVSWKSKSLLKTILFGMIAFWVWRLLL